MLNSRCIYHMILQENVRTFLVRVEIFFGHLCRHSSVATFINSTNSQSHWYWYWIFISIVTEFRRRWCCRHSLPLNEWEKNDNTNKTAQRIREKAREETERIHTHIYTHTARNKGWIKNTKIGSRTWSICLCSIANIYFNGNKALLNGMDSHE